MYATPKVYLLYKTKISQTFSEKIGFKQAYQAKVIFKLYISDLPDFLNKESNNE